MPCLFDAHFHSLDPAHPLVESFTTRGYLARVKDLNVAGGAVVSSMPRCARRPLQSPPRWLGGAVFWGNAESFYLRR